MIIGRRISKNLLWKHRMFDGDFISKHFLLIRTSEKVSVEKDSIRLAETKTQVYLFAWEKRKRWKQQNFILCTDLTDHFQEFQLDRNENENENEEQQKSIIHRENEEKKRTDRARLETNWRKILVFEWAPKTRDKKTKGNDHQSKEFSFSSFSNIEIRFSITNVKSQLDTLSAYCYDYKSTELKVMINLLFYQLINYLLNRRSIH